MRCLVLFLSRHSPLSSSSSSSLLFSQHVFIKGAHGPVVIQRLVLDNMGKIEDYRRAEAWNEPPSSTDDSLTAARADPAADGEADTKIEEKSQVGNSATPQHRRESRRAKRREGRGTRLKGGPEKGPLQQARTRRRE